MPPRGGFFVGTTESQNVFDLAYFASLTLAKYGGKIRRTRQNMKTNKDILELLESRMARLEQAIEDTDRELADLGDRKARLENEITILKGLREELVALVRPKVDSLTAEIRRLLSLRSRSNDELARELEGRVNAADPKSARRLVFATVNQMRHRGEVVRDSKGVNRLKSQNTSADASLDDRFDRKRATKG